MKFSPLHLFLIPVFCFFSCDSGKDNNPEQVVDVIVINEGNFQSGDGTISTYDRETDEVELNVFERKNGFPLAATLQNVLLFDGRLYVTTNSPDKLEIISAGDLKSIAVIDEGLSSPYGLVVTEDVGIITNWGDFNSDNFTYENSFLALVNLKNNSISSTIPLDIQPQHIVIANSKIYISLVGNYLSPGNSVVVYEMETETSLKYVSTIEVVSSPDKMIVDRNGNIWLIHNSGSMTVIDTETDKVLRSIPEISVTGFNEKMVMNSTGDKIYYLSVIGFAPSTGAVYELDIEDITAPAAPIITGNNFYGLGVDHDGLIYVTNDNAFQGNGTVLTYDSNGILVGDFPTGRGPNAVLFQ